MISVTAGSAQAGEIMAYGLISPKRSRMSHDVFEINLDDLPPYKHATGFVACLVACLV